MEIHTSKPFTISTTDTVVMNSIPPNQSTTENPNISINNNNNAYNSNHFHFNKSRFSRCIIKLDNYCNSLLKRKIAFTLLILSLILVIVSVIQVIKKRNIINRNALFIVEVVIIIITLCMVLLQIILTKEIRNKIILGIVSCLLLLMVFIDANIDESKGNELIYVIVNCVLCVVMLGLNVVLLLIVKREIKVETQKQQHIEEIINFTETVGVK